MQTLRWGCCDTEMLGVVSAWEGCVHVWVTQLCLTLCNPMDCSLPGSSVHGILQARILEWVAISFSRGSSWPRDWTHVSCVSYPGRWGFFTTAPLGISGRGEPSVNKKVYCILLLSSSSVLEIDTLVYLSNRLIYLRKARIFSFSRTLLPRREYSRLKSDCF